MGTTVAIVFVSSIYAFICGVFSTNYGDLYELKKHLMTNYSNEIIPVEVVYEEVPLSLELQIHSISSFDDVRGVLTTICSFILEWRDQILDWKYGEYNYARAFHIPLSKIWTPPLQIMNTANNLRLDYDATSTYAYVQFNGRVSVEIGQVLSTTCTPDVRYYPMDYHNCKIRVSPTLADIRTTSSLSVEFISDNAQWDLISSSRKEERSASNIITQVFTLTIKRRSEFLLISLVMPVIFLSVINLFVFIMPFESGERVGFTMTVLLAFAVFLTITTDKLPEAGNTTSVFCIYLAFMLMYSGCITLVNIIILSFYHKDEDKNPLKHFKCLNICAKKSSVSSLDIIDTPDSRSSVAKDASKVEPRDIKWYCNVADRIMTIFFALILFIASSIFIVTIYNAS